MLVMLTYMVFIAVAIYMNYSNTIEKISGGFYNNYSLKVKTGIFVGENGILNLKKLYRGDTNNFVLYNISSGSNEIRGVLTKGKTDTPNMISGRYFSASDFFSEKKVAVIGKAKLKKTFTDGDKMFISLFGNAYEVIGVIGYNNATLLDSYIYYNLDSINSGFLYYVDGKSSRFVQKTLDMIKSIGEAEVISDRISGINRLLKYNTYNSEIVRWGMLLTILLLLTASYFIIGAVKKEICIYKFLGFSKLQAAVLILNYFYFIELIGVLLSAFIYFLVGFSFSSLKDYMPHFSIELVFIPLIHIAASFAAVYSGFEIYWHKNKI